MTIVLVALFVAIALLAWWIRHDAGKRRVFELENLEPLKKEQERLVKVSRELEGQLNKAENNLKDCRRHSFAAECDHIDKEHQDGNAVPEAKRISDLFDHHRTGLKQICRLIVEHYQQPQEDSDEEVLHQRYRYAQIAYALHSSPAEAEEWRQILLQTEEQAKAEGVHLNLLPEFVKLQPSQPPRELQP